MINEEEELLKKKREILKDIRECWDCKKETPLFCGLHTSWILEINAELKGIQEEREKILSMIEEIIKKHKHSKHHNCLLEELKSKIKEKE